MSRITTRRLPTSAFTMTVPSGEGGELYLLRWSREEAEVALHPLPPPAEQLGTLPQPRPEPHEAARAHGLRPGGAGPQQQHLPDQRLPGVPVDSEEKELEGAD